MRAFAKPLLLSAAGFTCVGAAIVAQSPVPPVPPVPAVTPVAGVAFTEPADVFVQTAPRAESRPAVAQGYGGGGFGQTMTFRTFGDDPRTRELARKLADAKDDEAKDKLREELKASLTKAFDDRLKGQEKQVEELEKQLKKLRETVAKRKDAKAAIVTDRLAALEKEAKGLGW